MAEPRLRFLRNAAEAYAIAWFGVRGFAVAVPAQPATYDLLVSVDGKAKRVQVKTTTFRGRHGTWSVAIGQRPYELDKNASRTAYDPDSLEYFFIVDGDQVVYLIPSAVVGGRLVINVGAYVQYAVGNASSLFAGAASAAATVGS